MRKATLVVVLLLSFLAGGVIAYGATAGPTKDTNQPYNFLQGFYVGSASVSKPLIKRISYGTLDYDFPATAALNTGGSQRICSVSSNVTVTGARLGDMCLVGVDQAVSPLVQYTVQVTAADTAIIQECSNGATDGGVLNQADSGWTVVCFGRGT